MISKKEFVRVPAIEIEQVKGRRIYSFGIDGKVLEGAVAISRIRRMESREVDGYQRPEVVSHIREIRRYIESESPMIPNALVVAFDERVRFEPSVSFDGSHGKLGTLVIPVDRSQDESDRAGWVVDGQQRLAAIREADVASFPVFVSAFITSDQDEQRAQFILVNNTKPLPKGLIHELLPATEGKLPAALQRRRFPAMIMERLNFDSGSPFQGRIKSPTNPDGLIKDNSVLRMIENSLQDGALYRYWDSAAGTGDTEAMLSILSNFWVAVAGVFGEAWNLPPRRSRLVHGVGIVSLGFVMDAIADRYRQTGVPSCDEFRDDLVPLLDVCSWTANHWDFGPGAKRKWNELQNTTRDVQLLANFLLSEYKARVWDREPSIG